MCFIKLTLFSFADTPEYIILKDHLADVIDLLAGNAPVITQLSNHFFSSGLILEAVHLNPKSSPLERASQLINSVLKTSKTHSDPSSVFHGLITSLEKVGLTDMAKELYESLGKLRKMYYHNTGRNFEDIPYRGYISRGKYFTKITFQPIHKEIFLHFSSTDHY